LINKHEEASNLQPERVSSLYKPGPFWENALENIAKNFVQNGIENFRNSILNLEFFVPTYGTPGNGFSKKQIDSIVEKTVGFSLKQRAYVKNSFNGLNHASADYGTFFSSNFKNDPLNLLSFSESSVGNPVEHFTFDKRHYSRSALNYLLGLTFLQHSVPNFVPSKVLEIGGGFGTLGEILYKCKIPDLQYINLDLPPMFSIASQYSKSVFSETEVCELNDPLETNLAIGTLSKLNFLPNWSIERLEGEIDLFVNFISFQEMEPEIVKNYAYHIQRLNPNFLLLRNLREGKQKVNGNKLGVKNPIMGKDYLSFFDRYKVKELNAFPFGYRTVDGFNSELMLLERK
jgi:putative sugar O-methyltransferase